MKEKTCTEVNVVSKKIVVTNKLGLHARAASKLINLAESLIPEITIETKGQRASASSVMELLTLCCIQGTEIILYASGSNIAENQHALNKVILLFEQKFQEES